MIIAVYIFLVIGVFFAFVGTLGILRMPDVYGKLQASTCIATMGTLCVTVAAILYAISAGMTVGTYVKLGVLLVFVWGTNPVSNHALIKAAYKMGAKPNKEFKIDDYKEDEAK